MLKQDNLTTSPPHYRLRSFVRRDGRLTPGQTRAFETVWSCVGVRMDQGLLDFNALFNRFAPVCFEIGFGMGHSLLAAAVTFPDQNFIGIETHLPGIGALLLGIEKLGLTNLRVMYGDVVDALERNIAPGSLSAVQIFFPDPWPKRRHHPRRLIQLPFLQQLQAVLKPGGTLHLATDWADYATHMRRVLTDASGWLQDLQAPRSPYRPHITKFENRALRENRAIFEMCCEKA